jgi:hypothetical protein
MLESSRARAQFSLPPYISSFTQPGVQSWSAGGSGLVEPGLPTAALCNPAAMNADRITLYAEAGKRMEADWVYDIQRDGQWITPSFVSLTIPDNDWLFSAGYANFYDDYSATSMIETTPAFPEGAGESFESTRSVVVRDLYGSAMYRVANQLSLGLTVGLNIESVNETFWYLEGHGKGTGVMVVAGVLYQPFPEMRVGSAVTIPSPISMTESFPSESNDYRTQFPWSVNTGVGWIVSPVFEVNLGGIIQHWTSVSENYDNVYEFHWGMVVHCLPEMTARFGFIAGVGPFPNLQQYDKQNYLTVGIEYHYRNFLMLTGGIMDSHLLGGGADLPGYGSGIHHFHQTCFSLGMGYSL